MTAIATARPWTSPAFRTALLANFIWINVSEVARYFLLVKPMLHRAFQGDATVAPVTPAIFLSWMVWDTVLIGAATGFFWLVLTAWGASLRTAALAAGAFTVTVFGLLWLGVANMGLAPYHFLWTALPLAFAEQLVAALIVLWALRRRRAG